MFSKILIKLIDQSVVPAVLLLSTRVISVIVLARYLNLNFTFSYSGFEFATEKDYVLANSYSAFAMVVVLALGLFYILLKSLVLHDTHITPSLTARIFSLRLSSFIQSSFNLYSQGAIWLSYLYLLMLVSGIMALFKLLYVWVFFASLILAVIATVLLVLDVENELEIAKDVGEEPGSDDFVLNFGDDYE